MGFSFRSSTPESEALMVICVMNKKECALCFSVLGLGLSGTS